MRLSKPDDKSFKDTFALAMLTVNWISHKYAGVRRLRDHGGIKSRTETIALRPGPTLEDIDKPGVA